MTLFARDPATKRNLANVGGVATHANTAHIPGGGPKGRVCLDCVHFLAATRKGNGRCWLAANMRGFAYRFTQIYRKAHPKAWWHGMRTIKAATPSCKYWAERQ